MNTHSLVTTVINTSIPSPMRPPQRLCLDRKRPT